MSIPVIMNSPRIFLVSLFITLPACSDEGVSPVNLEHRMLWESLGIHHYSFDQQRQCFCSNGGRRVQVVVRADTIASISSIDTLQPPVQSGSYLTVDSLFGFIEWARAFSGAKIEISYNERYGYPERIFFDPLPNAVDDEIAYITSNFRAIK